MGTADYRFSKVFSDGTVSGKRPRGYLNVEDPTKLALFYSLCDVAPINASVEGDEVCVLMPTVIVNM